MPSSGPACSAYARLRELVAKYIDADFVAAVAAEHAKGRRLVGCHDQSRFARTAIWDMGRIASLRTPEALNLFRDVVAASASLPVVFPPMLVTAEANGRRFQEMHVDGGVDRAGPDIAGGIPAARRQTGQGRTDLQLYILINNKVEPEFQLVANSTIEIAARSSSTIVKTQTRSILYSTYDFTRRNKFGFNLTYIEGRIPAAASSGFDTAYMRGLVSVRLRPGTKRSSLVEISTI